MLSTKTKAHIRRRLALLLPRWGVLLASIGMLGGAVAFTGAHLQVVEVTDTHGSYSLAITSADDVQTLLEQTGITPPQGEDDLVITEEGNMVGYVSNVAPTYCDVTTVIDTNMQAGALVTRTREAAIAEGDYTLMSEGNLRLSYL